MPHWVCRAGTGSALPASAGRFSTIPALQFFLLTSVFWLTGCSSLWTMRDQYIGVGRMLENGDFSTAKAQIERSRLRHYPNKDRALYYLDLGLLQHYLGDYRGSIASLEQAEQAMDKAFVTSLARAGASYVLNDNVLEYAGEEYENIYVNVFQALNFLALDDFDSAFVEIRRIDEKLKVLESRYWKVAQKYQEAAEHDEPFTVGKNRFRNSALGRWLSLLIYRAEGRPDEAAIDLRKIDQAKNLAPSIYNFSLPDLSATLKTPAAGKVKVPVLGLIGQAPDKQADTLWIHTQLNQIFIGSSQTYRPRHSVLGGASVIVWPGMEPGYTFKFEMPKIVKRGTKVRSIRLRIDGQPGPSLQQLESLENSAKAAFEIKKNLLYLKTISRAVAKGIAAGQSQRKAESEWGELYGTITGLLAGIGIGVTENADLRISRFFPARACIAEAELTPGSHRIAVEYYADGGLLLHRDERTVDIKPEGVNLIESFYLN